MEQRIGVDQMLNAGQREVTRPQTPAEPDDAAIVRQNREALASWGAAGVPVKAPVG